MMNMSKNERLIIKIFLLKKMLLKKLKLLKELKTGLYLFSSPIFGGIGVTFLV